MSRRMPARAKPRGGGKRSTASVPGRAVVRTPVSSARAVLPETHVELLAEAPAALERPLGLVGGRGYAATWLHARVSEVVAASETERENNQTAPTARAGSATSEIGVDAVPRRVRVERRLVVARDDGVVFGDGGDQQLGELGIAVRLEGRPAAERLWRKQALDGYREGQRPNAADIFRKLMRVHDAFVDFHASLADQESMCALMATASLATWLTDAFALLPYLWLTGERGSGKTQLGTVWAMTSYLGEVVLSSGSFAAMRELAAVGAALYFDDAEAAATARGLDNAKRELMRAGNRRGARVPVQERVQGRWQTRWVSAYIPRAFSSIAFPEPTLASRAIIVPLVRTIDSARGSRDVADEASWPVDRRALQDELWAFYLAHLAEAAERWQALEASGSIVGREYEKWRPLLVVARLVEARGVPQLEARLRWLMDGYQSRRQLFTEGDEATEVVRALVWCIETSLRKRNVEPTPEVGADPQQSRQSWLLPTVLIANELEENGEGSDFGGRHTHAAMIRIGMIMRRLGFTPARSNDYRRTRGWAITIERIVELARAYGVPTRLIR